MFSAGGAFGLLFGTFGLLIAAFGIGAFVWMARKAADHNRTLREGLMAEARCLETFVVHRRSSNGPVHSQRRMIIGFYTFDGRDIRAEVTSHQPYVSGDIVPVRYLPDRPERAIPAGAPTGTGASSCLAGGMLVTFICMGLFVAALGFGFAIVAGT